MAKTIVIVRETMRWAEVDYLRYIEKIPQDQIGKRTSRETTLKDGTRILLIPHEIYMRHGVRGYSDVEYA
jgi:hypothetical protein